MLSWNISELQKLRNFVENPNFEVLCNSKEGVKKVVRISITKELNSSIVYLEDSQHPIGFFSPISFVVYEKGHINWQQYNPKDEF